MQRNTLLPQLFTLTAVVLLLGALGLYWPRLVGANDAPARAITATIGDAITYQGYLTDNADTPLDGQQTMRFQIYNAASGGSLLWDSGTISVGVNDGLFDVRLAIPDDIFNGEELWLAQTVGSELLTPRQEMLPAPLAHGLRPGAVVKATSSDIPNNYALEVQMNNDAFAFNRGAITGQATTGNAIYGLANSGRAVYGQTQDGYAVYGFDGGSDPNRGYGGYFYSTNGIGVYGYSNGDRTSPNIYAPGVYGQSNRGVGVYGRGDTSNSFNFYNEGGYFVGGRGLYARGTDNEFEGGSSLSGYGARLYSTEYRALYAIGDSDDYDAHFDGGVGIIVDGIVLRSAGSQLIVFNGGDVPIEAGDMVAMIGVADAPVTGKPMLAVAKLDASNRAGVIGVATEAFSAEPITHEDDRQTSNFTEAGRVARPNGHLAIITDGLAAEVKVDDASRAADWSIGEKISIGAGGAMMRVSDADNAVVIGKLAGQFDAESGTVAIFIDID